MKIWMSAAAAAFAVSVSAPALAMNEDILAGCEAYHESHGGEADCACLASEASGAVVDELLGVSSPDDVEGLSQESKDVIASCTA